MVQLTATGGALQRRPLSVCRCSERLGSYWLLSPRTPCPPCRARHSCSWSCSSVGSCMPELSDEYYRAFVISSVAGEALGAQPRLAERDAQRRVVGAHKGPFGGRQIFDLKQRLQTLWIFAPRMLWQCPTAKTMPKPDTIPSTARHSPASLQPINGPMRTGRTEGQPRRRSPRSARRA